MTDYIKGSMGYLGIEDANIDFFYNTIGIKEGIDDREGHYQQLFMQARGIVGSVLA